MQKTVRIDPDLVPWLEAEIERKRFNNIPHAVNFALLELKRRDEKIKEILQKHSEEEKKSSAS